MKGGAVDGSRRLTGHKLFQFFGPLWAVRIPSPNPRDLSPGKFRNVSDAAAGVTLNAKAKVIRGFRSSSAHLFAAPDGDESVFPARLDVGLEGGHVQQIFTRRKVAGRPGKNSTLVLLQLGGGPRTRGIQKFSVQQLLQIGVEPGLRSADGLQGVVVKKIAGQRSGVQKYHVFRLDQTPLAGQSRPERVQPGGLPVQSDAATFPLVFVVPGTGGGVVTPVVGSVLVIVVHKQVGRAPLGFAKRQGQIGPVSAAVTETELSGSGVNPAGRKQGSLSVQQGQLAVVEPVAKTAQRQILRHHALLPLGNVETGPLHHQLGTRTQRGQLLPLAAGQKGIEFSLLFGRRTIGFFFFFFFFGSRRLDDVKGARADRHVKQTWGKNIPLLKKM